MRTGVVWMQDGMSTLVDLLPQLKPEYEELVLGGGEGTQYRLLAAVRKTFETLPLDWYEHALPRRTHHTTICSHWGERDMSPPSEIPLNLSE